MKTKTKTKTKRTKEKREPKHEVDFKLMKYTPLNDQLSKIVDPDDKVIEKLGLYDRYKVTKQNGTPLIGDEYYFTLRLDRHSDDSVWTKCCRKAARELVRQLRKNKHLPKLANDLEKQLDRFKKDKK